ncbi:MAG: hypothetical protein ABMA13_10200 [Chthoniobacteraceae bacterium]
MRDRKSGKPERRPSPSNTPLDAEKRRLQEEAARLQSEMEQNKRLIEEAPKLKEKAEKQRREELVKRRSTTDVRFGRPEALVDPRHAFEANVGAAVQGRRLRKHRRQGMWTFFVLLCVLAGVLYWVYAVVIRGLNQ